MRILLIDDDKDDQLLFREAIRHITDDIIFETADNGIEGLKRLYTGSELPHILFLDINMPLMDGRETLRSIRSNQSFDALVIVICSTSRSEQDLQWAARANARYLVKPNNFPSWIKSLSATLNAMPIGSAITV